MSKQKEKASSPIRVHIWLDSNQVDSIDMISDQTGLTRSYLLRDAVVHWFRSRRADQIKNLNNMKSKYQ